MEKIVTYNDKKQKHQSGEASLEIGRSSNPFISGHYSASFQGYGVDEIEATEDLKLSILDLKTKLEKVLIAIEETLTNKQK